MATFTVTTDTNYTALSGVANGDIVNISQGAVFTINTDTVNLQTISCLSIGKISIVNASTTTPIFLNLGTSTLNGLLQAQAGALIEGLGAWITIGTSTGAASQTFTLPTSAGAQQYSRLGGVWVGGTWWPCVTSLTEFDSDATGNVCVHNVALNRIEFGDGTAGAVPANGVVIQVPNIQIRYNDTASAARNINIDLYTTGTIYLRQCALDGYIGSVSGTTDFHSTASQWVWDRVCMDVGSNANTNMRWSWDSPDAASSMIDVCFSRMSGSAREFQITDAASKFILTRVKYISLVNASVTISGLNSVLTDVHFMFPNTTIAPTVTLSGRRMYTRGLRFLSRGPVVMSGTEQVHEDVRITHRVTRTATAASSGSTVQLTGEGVVVNGLTDWKTTNRYFNPTTNAGLLLITGLNCQVFNVYDIGDTASTQGNIFKLNGKGARLYDASVYDNAPRGNFQSTRPDQVVYNLFTTDTTTTSDSNAVVTPVNNMVFESLMLNYRTTATRILNGVSTGSQARYLNLTPAGIGSDIQDVLLLRGDLGRTAGMLCVIFGQEKTIPFYEADPANTGQIIFDNNGRVYMSQAGDRFTIMGRKHYGINGWGDILWDGTSPLSFTLEFRAKEGDGSFGPWYALTTANLTTATSGFTDMVNNGVTLQYRITRVSSNLVDNLNMIEVRCTVASTYVADYVVENIVSSGNYTLHRVLDMSNCLITGRLVFTVAGDYTLTNCTITEVVNTSGGTVTITPSGSTTIATNTGPNINIVTALAVLTLEANVSLVGAEIHIYDLDNTPAGSLGTELIGVESCPTATFDYTGTAGNTVWIQILKDGYVEFGQSIVTPATSQTLVCTLAQDVNT